MAKHFQESSAIWALTLLENLTLMLFSNQKRYSVQESTSICRILGSVHFCEILALRNQISFIFILLHIYLSKLLSQHILLCAFPFFITVCWLLQWTSLVTDGGAAAASMLMAWDYLPGWLTWPLYGHLLMGSAMPHFYLSISIVVVVINIIIIIIYYF